MEMDGGPCYCLPIVTNKAFPRRVLGVGERGHGGVQAQERRQDQQPVCQVLLLTVTLKKTKKNKDTKERRATQRASSLHSVSPDPSDANVGRDKCARVFGGRRGRLIGCHARVKPRSGRV